MEKQMVQCEDGRRRQARIHGVPKEEGGYKGLEGRCSVKRQARFRRSLVQFSNQNLVFYYRSGR